MKKKTFLVTLLGLVALLAGCAPAASTAPKPSTGSAPAAAASPAAAGQQLSVTALDTMHFEPSTLTAKAGQPIIVTLKNGGQTLHDFSMTEGPAQPVKIQVQPGQTGSATFTIDKPGSYTFFCSQPGHEAAGMKGTLTVQ